MTVRKYIYDGLRKWFSDAECTLFRDSYLAFRCGINRLALAAVEKKQTRWHIRPKLHQLEHCAYDFLPKNPKYYHNFLNEDYIRRAKKLAIRSHPNFMARHVLFRYAVQTCLRWKKADVQPKPIRCGGFSHVALWFTFSVRGFRPTLSPIVDNHPGHLMMLNQLKSPHHVSQAFERKPYTVRNRTVFLDTCKHSNNRTHMATGSI